MFADALDPHDWPALCKAIACPDWSRLLQQFSESPQGHRLLAHLVQRSQQGAIIFPPDPLAMLRITSLPQVQVVILGQDPYHQQGQAHGLAFSVPHGVRIPPSLRNIFAEIQRDLGDPPPRSGHLGHWAQQGVLLLNTCLTVEQGQPLSHAGLGWESLTQSIVRACSAQSSPRVFMLWGAHAQQYAPLIDTTTHLVLQANHPSPLSARRPPSPFLGCGHFRLSNQWLTQKHQKNICWHEYADKISENMA